MRTALLFPGQGSQFVGMGRDLYEQRREARDVFDAAGEILGFDLAGLCFNGPEEVLRETRNTQPAIFVHSLAVLACLRDRLQDCRETDSQCIVAAAGHSLGEYTACVAAQAMSFAQGLRLVRRRGELMYEAGLERPGTMAALLGLDYEAAKQVCDSVEKHQGATVRVANVNAPTQMVISGEVGGVRAAMEEARRVGARRVVELAVSGAFHSPLMESAAAGLREALATVAIEDARFPIVANATARPIRTPDEIRRALEVQLLSPVLWEPSMRAIAAAEAESVLELGPGRVLTGLLRSIDRERPCQAVGDAAALEAWEGEAR